MLARKFRLLTPLPVRVSIYSKTPFFVMKAQPNGLSLSRFGFVIGKSVDKRATARNRAKRILRSCIEDRLLVIRPGFDILFILKTVETPKEQVAAVLTETLKKNNLVL